MLDFSKIKKRLQVSYQPEFGSHDWVSEKLNTGGVQLLRTFHFTEDDVISANDETASDEDPDFVDDEPIKHKFLLGTLRSSYYHIPGARLAIDHDLFLTREMNINTQTFVAHRNISIFRHIDRLIGEDIYIGGSERTAIPIVEFRRLLKEFPNSTELDHYARARIARILKDYFETTTDAEKTFNDYMRRRRTTAEIREMPNVYEYERRKYEFIRDAIVELLKDENSYSEDEWRDLMLKFILLIFPKYVYVLRNVLVKDFYTSSGTPSKRYIDMALVDAQGNVDVIEIKKPYADCLVSEGLYRGNHTPRKELSGAIMQAEKYIFHLNKWGVDGEKDINKRQSGNLPPGLQVKVTNPKAIVIAGRSNNLKPQQLFDFELIKRKYANVIDILSYDDLLRRLTMIIEKFNATP
ncbi:MAG: Shedu immune nuclease family protein [Alphaproteobacteria bacterium]